MVDGLRPVAAASTIKVLILITALRRVQGGLMALDERLALPAPADRAGGTGVLRELPSVRELAVADLLNLMIVVSDNAATNVILDRVGLAEVNQCARALGCTATSLQRHLMDYQAKARGQDNITTALDQARVLDALATGRALDRELTGYALDALSRQQVRDRLPAHLPASARCWNKTGEQRGLRHDVGLIGVGNQPQAVVAVLVDGLTDERSRGGYRGGPACELIAGIGAAVYRALLPEGSAKAVSPSVRR